jgi:hypothetical protein
MGCLLLWAVVSVSLTVSARPGPVASGETAKSTAAGDPLGCCAYSAVPQCRSGRVAYT